MKNILFFVCIVAAYSALVYSQSPRSVDNRLINCNFKVVNSIFLGNLRTCVVNQAIDSDAYDLGSEVNATVEQFYISNNRDVGDLPRQIGRRFPNLIGFRVKGCGLTIVRDFYFTDMKNLRVLCVMSNKIATIASGAFKDLISLERLFMSRNMIEAIHENIFASMVNLRELYLDSNKIKFLSSTAFKIPSGMLGYVDLRSNFCIDERYGANSTKTLGNLDTDIKSNCKQ